MMRMAAAAGGVIILAGMATAGNMAMAAPTAGKAPPQHAKPVAAQSQLPKSNPNAISVVHAGITINKKVLHYTVTTGYLPMKSNGKSSSQDFFYRLHQRPQTRYQCRRATRSATDYIFI